MTEPKPRCGASNTRCAGCGRAVGSFYDQCPVCGGDVEPSTCRRPAIAGGRCHQHGGRAGQTVAAEHTRQIATSLQALTEEYDLGPVDNPFEALLTLAGQARAWSDLLGDRVAQLASDGWRYEHSHGGEQVRAELTLFERALDRCHRVLADVSRLRIEERLVEVRERVHAEQVAALADLVLPVLEALPGAAGQPGTLQQEVRSAIVARIRAHNAGGPLPPPPVLPEYVPKPASIPAAVAVPDPLVPSVTSGPSVPSVRPVEPSDAEDRPPAPMTPVGDAEGPVEEVRSGPAGVEVFARPVAGVGRTGRSVDEVRRDVAAGHGSDPAVAVPYREGDDPILDRMRRRRRGGGWP